MSGKPAVWDIVTRVWHWLMVLAIPAMWFTAENGYLSIHITIGTVLVGFLIFRISWGIWGSTTARFAHFVKGPKALFGYMGTLSQSPYKPHFGHNPMGGLSVIAILLALMVQLGTGLVAEDTDGLYSGPLSSYVDYDTAHKAAEIHELAFNALLALIVLHILAVAFYLVIKKTNLVRPMVTGKMMSEPAGTEKAELKKPGLIALLVSLALAGGVVTWLFL